MVFPRCSAWRTVLETGPDYHADPRLSPLAADRTATIRRALKGLRRKRAPPCVLPPRGDRAAEAERADALGERAAFSSAEADVARDESAPVRAHVAADPGDGVDFASRRAARGKARFWLAALTAAVAVAILIVVSVSVLHAA
jgi:hypothetical protein